MIPTKVIFNGSWFVPVNEERVEAWTCPKCGNEMSSCCGNSHIWCYNCKYEFWSLK